VEGGAGTKVAMNLVGNFSVQQGTSGDLLIGLPTQMTEMHRPARLLYLIDAPVARVKVLEHSFLIRDVLGGCLQTGFKQTKVSFWFCFVSFQVSVLNTCSRRWKAAREPRSP